jgi:hypothetical protein
MRRDLMNNNEGERLDTIEGEDDDDGNGYGDEDDDRGI